MPAAVGKEFRILLRDANGRQVQRFIYASSSMAASRKAKEIAKNNRAVVVSVKSKKSFAYKVTRGNQIITGTQVAYTKQEVNDALTRLGFRVAFVRRSFGYGGRVSSTEMVSFIGTSAKLLEQKMAYAEVLRIMSTNVRDKNLRSALRDVILDLKNGVDSREAFIRQGRVFGEHIALLLGIASKSANMAAIFKSVAQLVERQTEFKKGLTSSLILPAVTSLTLIGAIAFYVVYLLPEMANMLAPMIDKMPPLTEFTLKVSEVIRENMVLILGTIVLITAAFYYYLTTEDGKMAYHRNIVKVPYVGRIIRNSSVEIFCRVLGIVYSSSGENIDAIKLAAEASGNYYFEKQIRTVAIPLMLKYGTEFAVALERTMFFPEMVISRFRTAGETGDVKSTAIQLADFYQTENQFAMKNLVAVIEVSISVMIMIALVFLTYLSSETAAIRINTH